MGVDASSSTQCFSCGFVATAWCFFRKELSGVEIQGSNSLVNWHYLPLSACFPRGSVTCDAASAEAKISKTLFH